MKTRHSHAFWFCVLGKCFLFKSKELLPVIFKGKYLCNDRSDFPFRVITAFRLNTLIPISMVAENMKRAQKRDSVLNQKFYFRKEISRNSAYKVDELTVNEIINGEHYAAFQFSFIGTSSGFVGFIPLIYRYLDTVKMESNTRHRIMSYLTFISVF